MTIVSGYIKDTIISDLDLTPEEAEVFLRIISNGKLSLEHISEMLGKDLASTLSIVNSVIDKGMIIEYSNNVYECLHPRFALVNRYKYVCQKTNVAFKKKPQIDNIGVMLQHYFDSAR